jgi:hypothetical protein
VLAEWKTWEPPTLSVDDPPFPVPIPVGEPGATPTGDGSGTSDTTIDLSPYTPPVEEQIARHNRGRRGDVTPSTSGGEGTTGGVGAGEIVGGLVGGLATAQILRSLQTAGSGAAEGIAGFASGLPSLTLARGHRREQQGRGGLLGRFLPDVGPRDAGMATAAMGVGGVGSGGGTNQARESSDRQTDINVTQNVRLNGIDRRAVEGIAEEKARQVKQELEAAITNETGSGGGGGSPGRFEFT